MSGFGVSRATWIAEKKRDEMENRPDSDVDREALRGTGTEGRREKRPASGYVSLVLSIAGESQKNSEMPRE